MKAFGFLSFGHYGHVPGSQTPDAASALKQAVELAVAADEIGVNGAYFRVHHFERQLSSPIPLLSTIAARTQRIEVGTGVIDLRYENPLQLAEELAALDLLSDQRLAIGISRGSPETAVRGYEAFGYTGSQDPRGGRPRAHEVRHLPRRRRRPRHGRRRPATGATGLAAAHRTPIPGSARSHLVGLRIPRNRRMDRQTRPQPDVVHAADRDEWRVVRRSAA